MSETTSDFVKAYYDAIRAMDGALARKERAARKLGKASRTYSCMIQAVTKAEKALKKHILEQANLAVELTKERLSGGPWPLSASLVESGLALPEQIEDGLVDVTPSLAKKAMKDSEQSLAQRAVSYGPCGAPAHGPDCTQEH